MVVGDDVSSRINDRARADSRGILSRNRNSDNSGRHSLCDVFPVDCGSSGITLSWCGGLANQRCCHRRMQVLPNDQSASDGQACGARHRQHKCSPAGSAPRAMRLKKSGDRARGNSSWSFTFYRGLGCRGLSRSGSMRCFTFRSGRSYCRKWHGFVLHRRRHAAALRGRLLGGFLRVRLKARITLRSGFFWIHDQPISFRYQIVTLASYNDRKNAISFVGREMESCSTSSPSASVFKIARSSGIELTRRIFAPYA